MRMVSLSWPTCPKNGQIKQHYEVLSRSFCISVVYFRVNFDPYYHRQDSLMNTGKKEDGRKRKHEIFSLK